MRQYSIADESLNLVEASRGKQREGQRGFVLLTVLILALLFFALMGIVLTESIDAYRGAQRLRSRATAQALAETGAELVARDMITKLATSVNVDLQDGHVRAEYKRLPNDLFEIESTGRTTGSFRASSTLKLTGQISGTEIKVMRAEYSQ